MTDVELVPQDEAALHRRRGDYDPEQVRLIKATVAEGATDAELAMFLELSARYGLDPFAKEIWCVKSQRQDGGTGRLLIMVGRDGLRKLARRARAQVDQDVVRENDTFSVHRDPDGSRQVEHGYNGSQAARGPIVGAWCEVSTQDSYGFFYAPLEEYLPTSEAKLRYSPWGSQRSVMILAAAERQALRMAIPLSGVVVEGEMELNEERAAGEVSLSTDIGWPTREARERLEPRFAAVNALAPHTYGPGAIDLLVRGQDVDALSRLAQRLDDERAVLEASQGANGEVAIPEAEVVDAQETPQDDALRLSFPRPTRSPEPAPEPPPAAEIPSAPEGPGGPLSALFAAQDAQAPPARGPAQQEMPAAPPPVAEPPPAEEPVEPPPAEPPPPDPGAPTELPPIEESPAASVPQAGLEDLKADLAYWMDVQADPEYRDQQGISEDEVESNIAELRSAIEGQA